MAYSTLIAPEALAPHLGDPAWAIVDCRFALEDTGWGERAYAVAHIPGAVYAHLDRDLSGIKTGRNGRHPLPTREIVAGTFSRLGIDEATQVVAYSAQTDMFSARLWWMLRWLGHDRAAVLDGGFDRWTAEGRPVRAGLEARTPRTFTARERPGMLVEGAAVAKLLGNEQWRLVDARAPERYRGEIEPLDARAGHIPGAVDFPYRQTVNGSGNLLSREELRRAFESVMAGVAPNQVVCYCGSGVSACQDLLALEHAGLTGAKLYAGSWSEWSSDPARPIEVGEAAKTRSK